MIAVVSLRVKSPNAPFTLALVIARVSPVSPYTYRSRLIDISFVVTAHCVVRPNRVDKGFFQFGASKLLLEVTVVVRHLLRSVGRPAFNCSWSRIRSQQFRSRVNITLQDMSQE